MTSASPSVVVLARSRGPSQRFQFSLQPKYRPVIGAQAL
jgi:hypothetical protein